MGKQLYAMPMEALELRVAKLKDNTLFTKWMSPRCLEEEIMEWWHQNFKDRVSIHKLPNYFFLIECVDMDLK